MQENFLFFSNEWKSLACGRVKENYDVNDSKVTLTPLPIAEGVMLAIRGQLKIHFLLYLDV